MNEHDKARPVSGEIMTDGAAKSEGAQPVDFADAEFEPVERRPQPRASRAGGAASTAGMEMLRDSPRPAAAQAPRQPGGPLFWSAGLALVALAFWVSGGHAWVRQVALQAPAESVQALRIGDVESRVESRNGRDILFVDGRARNHGTSPLPLPPIEIAVTANDGAKTRYFLGTRGTELEPGGSYDFSSRLEAPTNGVRTVSVTFQEGGR